MQTRSVLLLLVLMCAGTRPGAAADALAEGLRAYAQGRYPQAMQRLLPLARAGDAEAQLRVGIMHYRALGTGEDDREAFAWFSRAARQGQAEAQYQLGNLYALGQGLPAEETDPDRESARWYFESAQRGNADAQYALGLLFLSGKGVVRDQEEAMKWLRRAAANGHADAQRTVGSEVQRR